MDKMTAAIESTPAGAFSPYGMVNLRRISNIHSQLRFLA
jgi:hypothetical protein